VLLLLVLATVAVILVQDGGDALGTGLWGNLAATGLLATGFALSLRTGTPNLAVGAQAALAGIVYAKLATAGWPAVAAGLTAVVLLILFGLLLGLLTGLTAAPAWAVSLGGLAIAQTISLGLSESRGVMLPGGPSDEVTVWLWAALFVLGSLAGGALFGLPGGRRALVPAATGPGFRASRLFGALAGFGGSSALAALSGIVLVGRIGGAFPTGDRLVVAVAAAVLGGISVFTFRGGVAGTLFATAFLVLADTSLRLADVPAWLGYSLVPGLAILFGILIGWVLDKIAGSEPEPQLKS
jgi:ribose/xylose/arabinose/galactoside ABC-type transport system permease subunit